MTALESLGKRWRLLDGAVPNEFNLDLSDNGHQYCILRTGECRARSMGEPDARMDTATLERLLEGRRTVAEELTSGNIGGSIWAMSLLTYVFAENKRSDSEPAVSDALTSDLDAAAVDSLVAALSFARQNGARALSMSVHTALGSSALEFDNALADGEIRDARPGLYNVWCCVKPVGAMVFYAALDAIGLDPRELTVGDLLEWSNLPISLEDVLSHRAGLGDVTLIEGRLASGDGDRLRALAERDIRCRRVPISERTTYSEFTPYFLLEQAMKFALDVPNPSDLATGSLKSASMGDLVISGTSETLTWPAQRSYFDSAPRSGGVVELMHDRLRDEVSGGGLYLGGFASCAGLSRWMHALLVALAGDGSSQNSEVFPRPELLRDLLYSPVEVAYYDALAAPCAFAGGLMRRVDLFMDSSTLPQSAVASVGWDGRSYVLGLPDAGLAVALICPDLAIDPRLLRDALSLAIQRLV